MSQPLNADQELVSDVVACQLVIKQILDVLDVIAPVEVREKMTPTRKAIAKAMVNSKHTAPHVTLHDGHHAGNPKSHRAY